ncbi:Type III restriction enzyme, res subunit family protein [Tritrichomonas foetus]|uniref:Type III restriction enzyme, res subunit family protein n=1 Tax=Tritrichomonas foetus TaxID=1144522 RepID=A0A1J4K4W4_9EUKA|nr:Type III restriction enzyme, res subunit family protein [Tritrichomonas foetus]|eukprot:OHT06018.1 Type III restriction enzyme, res subunit family protein [Tritrichomonas foetus]
MNQQQLSQLKAQLKLTAQLSTCASTNTRELDGASGVNSAAHPEAVFQANPMYSMAFWKGYPEAPHHKYMKCPLENFENHQIPIALLAQERDNYIQMKMQAHLRHLRRNFNAKNLSEDEKDKLELMTHYLFLNSRQKFVRDNFYTSFTAFTNGTPLKRKEIVAIVRMKPVSKQEKKKGYVIRGISYNDFLYPIGAEFKPDSPFTPLPRYVIRNRQKESPNIDLKQTLPVVKSVLSSSASLAVSSHAFEFYSSMRKKYQMSHVVKQNLCKREIEIESKKQLDKLSDLKSRIYSLADTSEKDFLEFWRPLAPIFTHGIRICPQPSNLESNAVLQRHQIEGMSWLIHLYDHHVNAVLADETGVGKTLQIISFFAYLAEQRHISGPHLVIMPKSVIQTWKDEFVKWFPTANTIVYVGKRKRRRNIFETTISRSEFDVLLTTYSIIKEDKELIAEIPWRVIVIDEGHVLKNYKTLLYSAIFDALFSDFKIIATATPFQNQIDQFWSILSLVDPSQFCSVEIFNSFFKELESSNQDPERNDRVIKRLQDLIRPYFLRRNKEDIQSDIPDKLEITLKCSPVPLQLSVIDESLKTGIMNTSQKIHMARKVSNSPLLFLKKNVFKTIPVQYILLRSPKMRLLDQILHKLILTGHRFLIYSQWTSMMDIISYYLDWREIQFLRIDGSVTTNDRMNRIKSFVQPDSTIQGMLLSTRSSAFGLNLQVADTVILFDSDYNPFVELQASARVHRLGQKNVVVVIRLMVNGTGEEKILRVSRKKFILGHQIIEAGRFNFSSTEEERAAILGEAASKPPELTDPTDEQLDSVVSRSNEEVATLQYRKSRENFDELPEYAEFDQEIIQRLHESDVDIPSESDEEEWEVIE